MFGSYITSIIIELIQLWIMSFFSQQKRCLRGSFASHCRWDGSSESHAKSVGWGYHGVLGNQWSHRVQKTKHGEMVILQHFHRMPMDFPTFSIGFSWIFHYTPTINQPTKIWGFLSWDFWDLWFLSWCRCCYNYSIREVYQPANVAGGTENGLYWLLGRTCFLLHMGLS